ncbi:MAG: hypothetical protein HC881_03185 [Leptolyngbyaceae cyanobacterium SL_7_1]|nr:hypothetical protein [Leptolyngbyaceae cyanobacterium SL_7_1]
MKLKLVALPLVLAVTLATPLISSCRAPGTDSEAEDVEPGEEEEGEEDEEGEEGEEEGEE